MGTCGLTVVFLPFLPIFHLVGVALIVVQFLFGIKTAVSIKKTKSTEGVNVLSIIRSLFILAICFRHAELTANDEGVKLLFLGIAVNILNLCVYYQYSETNGEDMFKPLVMASIIFFIIYMYSVFECPCSRGLRFGIITNILILLNGAYPLFQVKQMIETKNTSPLMPFFIYTGLIISTCSLIINYFNEQTLPLIFDGLKLFVICAQLAVYIHVNIS